MKPLFLIFILLLSFESLSSQDKETIVWGVFDHPPSLDLSDINDPKGISWEILKTIENGLTSYNHKHEIMNFGRMIQALKGKQNVCIHFPFKTPEREKYGYFSLPNRINLPLRIIIHKEAYQKIGKPQSVILSDFLAKTKLRGMIEKGRSYSKLDEILASYKDTTFLKQEVLTTHQAIKMLLLRRIDFFIDYSFNVDHPCSEIFGKSCNEIHYLPINETYEYAYSYAICPKNSWGKKVIKDINSVLKEVVKKPEYLQILKSPYQSEIEKVKIEEFYKKYFLKAFE